MSIPEKLRADLTAAMREKDQIRLTTLRALLTAITTKEKEGRDALTEEDHVAIIQKQAKQRRDAAEQFETGNREDLARREREELAVIETYLPKQLDDEQIQTHVDAIIEHSGANSMADMGRVMGQAMQQLKGRADGNRVRQIVQERLK